MSGVRGHFSVLSSSHDISTIPASLQQFGDLKGHREVARIIKKIHGFESC